MTGARVSMPAAYRLAVTLGTPIMLRWSRMTVTGLEHLLRSGPVLLACDHDSYWDPFAIAVAARGVRPVRALSKSTLWKNKLVGTLMDGMGHIPVHRDTSNSEAMTVAVRELRAGACIGVFPEGTRSLGRELRARSGLGRLAREVPEAVTVCCRANGTSDVVRAPHRPRVSVEFFRPAGGQLAAREDVTQFGARVLAEIRAGAPREVPGRRRTAAKYRAGLTAPPERHV